MKIGVLSLQGDVREHLLMLERIGSQGIIVKKKKDLNSIDALIIPGGESTTIGQLMEKERLIEPIRKLAQEGMPMYGTCAGLIVLAKKVSESNQPLLNLMDIEVRRNAFGRQRESFEADIEIKGFKTPFHAVFIRAPWIEKANAKVDILAEFNGKAVMAQEKNLLVTAFHPELTDDTRIHRYFLEIVKRS